MKDWTTQLLESIAEGIVALDDRMHIVFFNHGAERITGWSREEVLGRRCDDVFHLADSDVPFSLTIPGPGQKNKLIVELAGGHWASLNITSAHLFPSDAGEAELALVFRDVSSEEIVHNLLGHFIANIAHEFRTPLSALAALTELLRDEAPHLTSEERQELMQSLHISVLGLQTLIDNLLESASIEAGHFRVAPRPSDLKKIIRSASNIMQPLLGKYGQQLVLSLPEGLPLVQIDPRRTEQVLVNLLSNASKYGPSDGEITISATEENSWVYVEVSDQGSGVAPEQRDNLFQRFLVPSPKDTHIKIGAGLGLSVVKAIVEAQGGQTGFKDRLAGGSIFWFTCPIAGDS